MNIGKKIIAAAWIAAALATGCKNDDSQLQPEGMRFSQTRYDALPGATVSTELLIRFGDTEKAIDPASGAYGITMSTDNEGIACIGEDGKIAAIAYGSTQLTAVSSQMEGSATTEIVVLPASYRLDRERYTLPSGSSVRPQLMIPDGDGSEVATDVDFRIVWSTGDERIATVSSDGTITAAACGTTLLTGVSSLLPEDLTAEIVVELADLRFEQTYYTLDIDETVATCLLATASGTEAEAGEDLQITYEIADPVVAEVDARGRVHGLASGITTLTARTPYFSTTVSTQIAVQSEWSGEWMLSRWNDGTEMSGHVYLHLVEDGTFTLYQNIDITGFAIYKGTYRISPNGGQTILNGTYDDGVAWKDSYEISRDGDLLTLRSLSDGILSEYVRTEIPDYVKDGIVGSRATAPDQAARFL